MDIVAATNNKGKLKEIRSILKNYNILSLKDINLNVDIIEDANSFYGNASKKAKEIYELVNMPVLSDDSGLCLTGYEDFPGVNTHRFLGDNATDEDRNNYLVNMSKDDNRAKVVCDIVYYDGNKEIHTEGIITGKLVEARGENGFGFDPIFEVNGKTLGELNSTEKDNCSARSIALQKLSDELKKEEF